MLVNESNQSLYRQYVGFQVTEMVILCVVSFFLSLFVIQTAASFEFSVTDACMVLGMVSLAIFMQTFLSHEYFINQTLACVNKGCSCVNQAWVYVNQSLIYKNIKENLHLPLKFCIFVYE